MKVTIGDDITIRATLLLNGVVENLTGYTVRAALVGLDKVTLATGTAIVTATIVDAATGVVEAQWDRATTASITPGVYLVEIQGEIAGKRTTWDREPITLEPGAIA